MCLVARSINIRRFLCFNAFLPVVLKFQCVFSSQMNVNVNILNKKKTHKRNIQRKLNRRQQSDSNDYMSSIVDISFDWLGVIFLYWFIYVTYTPTWIPHSAVWQQLLIQNDESAMHWLATSLLTTSLVGVILPLMSLQTSNQAISRT